MQDGAEATPRAWDYTHANAGNWDALEMDGKNVFFFFDDPAPVDGLASQAAVEEAYALNERAHAELLDVVAQRGDGLVGFGAKQNNSTPVQMRLIGAAFARVIERRGSTALRELCLELVKMRSDEDVAALVDLVRASPRLEKLWLTACGIASRSAKLFSVPSSLVELCISYDTFGADGLIALCSAVRTYTDDETVVRISAAIGCAAARVLEHYIGGAPRLRILSFARGGISEDYGDTLCELLGGDGAVQIKWYEDSSDHATKINEARAYVRNGGAGRCVVVQNLCV